MVQVSNRTKEIKTTVDKMNPAKNTNENCLPRI